MLIRKKIEGYECICILLLLYGEKKMTRRNIKSMLDTTNKCNN